MPPTPGEDRSTAEEARDGSGRLYLNVPYEEKDEARKRGAVWDPIKRHWYVPPQHVAGPFQRWFPPPTPTSGGQRIAHPQLSTIPKPALPQTRAGRLARYYRLVLDHIDLDRLTEAEVHLGVDFTQLCSGQLDSETQKFGDFFASALKDQQRSPEPAPSRDQESPAAADVDMQDADSEPEQTQAVQVFALLILRSSTKKPYVLAALPAQLNENGELLPVADFLPLLNEAHYEPQVRRRYPLLGARVDLARAYEKLAWPQGQSWSEAWVGFSQLFGSANYDGLWPDQFAYEGQQLSAQLVPHERRDAMVQYLKELYLELWTSSGNEEAALYRAITEGAWPKPLLDERESRQLSPLHTGHMSSTFGLDPSQRVALQHLLATDRSRVLAVTGPPGTGKTACLEGVIATVFVNATLESDGPRPCIVVASSATNQAVTNIIKSFGKIAAAAREQNVSSRWLNVVESYGWYYASQTKAEEAQQFQLLDRMDVWKFDGAASELTRVVKSRELREELKSEYLRLFRRNFPAAHATTVEQATRHVLETLRTLARGSGGTQEVPTLPLMCSRAALLGSAAAGASMRERDRAARRLRRRDSRVAFVGRRAVALERAITHAEAKVEELTAHCLALSLPRFPFRLPSWLVTLLLWLKSLFQRERRQQLMRALSSNYDMATLLAPDTNLFSLADEALARARQDIVINSSGLSRLRRRDTLLRDNDCSWVGHAVTLHRELSAVESSLEVFGNAIQRQVGDVAAQRWLELLNAGLQGLQSPAGPNAFGAWNVGFALRNGGTASAAATVEHELEKVIDVTVRRRCFDLAARYWEGRWLLEDHEHRLPQDRHGLLAGLRRHCMLAPVIVATAYRLPKLFKLDRSSEEVILGAADLLILDEAGQAPPALSAGLFGLAQRALVVGDVEQLKPIWGIDTPHDRRLLRHTELDGELDTLEREGLLASSGSAMRLAQTASFFRGESGRAITLTRHYRCRPTIIEFCNRLVYDLTTPLEPMLPADTNPLFSPMTFVECRFACDSSRGSSLNRGEADTLIGWLEANRADIERRYNQQEGKAIRNDDPGYRDIGDLVAIITPFSAQREYLSTRVRTKFPGGHLSAAPEGSARKATAERMIVGTVHALQGAERPLVLFSAVSSPGNGKAPFMDANVDMLNVAVSRAQETFVLFGHPDLFFSQKALRPSNYAPSAVLGRYIYEQGSFDRGEPAADSPRREPAQSDDR